MGQEQNLCLKLFSLSFSCCYIKNKKEMRMRSVTTNAVTYTVKGFFKDQQRSGEAHNQQRLSPKQAEYHTLNCG